MWVSYYVHVHFSVQRVQSLFVTDTPLSTLLIKPVQRITKYPLLLKVPHHVTITFISHYLTKLWCICMYIAGNFWGSILIGCMLCGENVHGEWPHLWTPTYFAIELFMACAIFCPSKIWHTMRDVCNISKLKVNLTDLHFGPYAVCCKQHMWDMVTNIRSACFPQFNITFHMLICRYRTSIQCLHTSGVYKG